MIVPLFQILKHHLSPNPNDIYLIREMKSKMLSKLNSRYTTDQFKCLKTCTLLDVGYKNNDYVKKDFHQLKTGIKELLSRQEQQQSQHEIPATERQEIDNLSTIREGVIRSLFLPIMMMMLKLNQLNNWMH